MPVPLSLLIAFCFLIAAVLTFGIRYIGRKQEILDIPNERSSHAQATPHGGGLAIVLSFFGGLVYCYIQGMLSASLFYALLCVLPIAIVSLIDDIKPLSANIRFGIQFLSAISALYCLGGINELNLGLIALEGWWTNIAAVFILLWLTNLYNFLDGIDGYAGSEALFVGTAAFFLFGNHIGLIIAAAAAGFLLFNWHKASIFMGDVGSAPLGFIFAILMLYDASSANFLGWIVLLALFWLDATVTLYRRWKNGETLSQAHKKHAYQRLHQAGFAHDRIVLLGMGINILFFIMLWLTPSSHYWIVFLITVAILWLGMKYVDTKKAFV